MNVPLVKRPLFLILLLGLSFPVYSADYALLIGGQGGEARYTQQITQTVHDLYSILINEYGFTRENVRLLQERTDLAPHLTTTTTLEAIRSELKGFEERLTPDDTFLLVLVGHGQSDFQEAKFNIPGEDLTSTELRDLLEPLPAGTSQRFILAFPCSGHFTLTLSQPNRVILSSTDSARQVHGNVFSTSLLTALREGTADANADNRVDFRELFEFISRDVSNAYEVKGQLKTESPSLDDNGDEKVTTLDEGMDAGDGEVASQTAFVRMARETTP